MKEELEIPNLALTLKDLINGDYFRFITDNSLVRSNKICKIIEDSYGARKILIGRFYYDYEEYRNSKVIKLRPTKFENDILYFEEI